jgi:hypothetical protein
MLGLLLGCSWACGKTRQGDSDLVDGSGAGGNSPSVGGDASGAERGSSAGGTAASDGGAGGSSAGVVEQAEEESLVYVLVLRACT